MQPVDSTPPNVSRHDEPSPATALRRLDVPDGTTPRRVLVVGAGPAAHRLVEALVARVDARAAGLPAGAPGVVPLVVTVIGDEPHRPYDRVQLSRRLHDEVDLTLGDDALWAHPAVAVRWGRTVTALDLDGRRATLDDGEVLGWDEVVLATGSSATVPDVPGASAGRVYRTLADVADLVTEVHEVADRQGRPANVVTVGGGLLGLEAAGGVHALGARSAVVHSGDWLLSAQLDEGAGQALGRIVRERGLDLHLGRRPTEVLVGPSGRVTGVVLTDGTHVHADVVVFSIGITPRDELARASGLALGPRGGVVVDAACAASAPHVWAVGEVASVDGACTGLVAPAVAMAETVADRLWGGEAVFPGVDDATKLKLAGVEVASFGDARGTTPGALSVVQADPVRGLYQKVVVSDDAKTLLGGTFVGDAAPWTSLRPLLGRTLPAEPGAYLSGSATEAPSGGDLPDDVQACSCADVSVGTVRAAVRGDGGADPCHDLADLKACTRAGTRCGSCVPLVKKLLDAELAAAGVEVSRALCEHVDLSRAELFESVRILGLTSAADVFERFGRGLGCDVCKPVVASVLATQTKGYILDAGQGPLQDTNDRALANMQRDGTYSIVPRVPAGEITPAKLKVLAEVAERWDLYTKITGGQRIDLFGARLEELPEIWRVLVDAGFESGQAYGKALRNVKSCVGSTWCRFGVQDSVAMAVHLELRYRGLRSPHKFKMGVSGCARECAEARAKDVGVIATETGWNLYVGGNGGATPVHGQLLAKDLDDETLVRYVDRYLMWYVRTAERLQRTARWQEELDGGLDHVRAVVVDDVLGIGDELERAMAVHVAGYEDEWAATLADPERLRRFRPFVNAPDTETPLPDRVEERGQRRPAFAHERDGVPRREAVLVAGPTLPVREG